MQKIKVHLLGNPYVEINDERIHFPYKKMEGLFYYLCVKKNATRDEIIHVLWGSENENIGRKNLREALYQIKKLFGKDFLVIFGRTAIGLNPDLLPIIDWDILQSGDFEDFDDNGFMTHFFIKNSYEYDEWIDSMRDVYSEKLMKIIRKKLEESSKTKDIRKMQYYSDTLTKLDPYNENIYHEIMNMYASNGNYNMAIKLYYDLEKVFKEELGILPSKEIVDLFHDIFNLKKNLKDLSMGEEVFFYGRSQEVLELKESIDYFDQGKGKKCIGISGDVGVGKSSLMDKAKNLAKHNENIILSANCFREESEFFLRPWRDIIDEINRQIEEKKIKIGNISYDEKEVFNRIFHGGFLRNEEKESGFLSYQVIEETILGMFKRITKEHQVVLFFDDIQWMDSMSYQLLNRVILTFGLKKVFLIFAFPKNFESEIYEALDPLFYRDLIKSISVEGFTRSETNEIIDLYLPELKDEIKKKDQIYEMTEGNAFFLMELGNLIKEKGYTLELSKKTVNVIKGRLAGLSDKERELIDIISIFPEKVSVEEMELLFRDDRLDTLRQLERLERRHLIKEILIGWNVYYDFSHRIFHEYIYETQSQGKKTQYHQILANHYEEKLEKVNRLKQLPMIIYHYERAHNQLKTYQYKVQYYNEFYTIVHENFPVLHDEIEFSQEASIINTGVTEIIKLADEVTSWEDHSKEAKELKMEMHYITGRYGIAVGEYDNGKRHIEECILIAKELKDLKSLLNSYYQLVFLGIQIEDSEQIRQNLDEVEGLISKETEVYQYGIFLRLRSLYSIQTKKYEEAQILLDEAVAVFENRPHGERRHSMNIAACYNYMGDIRRHQKDFQGAYDYYCTAIKTNNEKVMTNGLAHFHSNAGQMLFHLGKVEESKEELIKALECFYKYGYRWGIGRAEAYMTLIELKKGNTKAAIDHYRKGLEVEKKIRNPSTLRILKNIKEKLVVLKN
ncbi:MAG: AAA family ATPase [Eubacteriaceae bacterium]